MVSQEDAPVEVMTVGALPVDVLGEVRIHQQIYRVRSDVNGIVRFQSPKVISLSAMGRSPRVYHGFGSYFAPSPPLWRDPRLIRDDVRAAGVVSELGSARAIVLRGNGAVVVGSSLQQACALAWYLEDAARVELDLLASGEKGLEFEPAESADRATLQGRIFERMWEWLTQDESVAEGVPYPS
jgi:HCOMODA/2-hydroxy-3-carboxy-muconic semialdehyde decarboxylase